MDNTTMIITVLVIVGGISGLVFAGRRRSERLDDQLGREYDRTVQAQGPGGPTEQQEAVRVTSDPRVGRLSPGVIERIDYESKSEGRNHV